MAFKHTEGKGYFIKKGKIISWLILYEDTS